MDYFQSRLVNEPELFPGDLGHSGVDLDNVDHGIRICPKKVTRKRISRTSDHQGTLHVWFEIRREMKEAIVFKYEIIAVEKDRGLNKVRVICDHANCFASVWVLCIEDRKPGIFSIYIDQSPRLPTI